MMTHPMLIKEVQQQRFNELLQEAEKERLLKQIGVSRPSLCANILAGVGSILITVGQKLEAQEQSNAAVPNVVNR